MGKIESTCFSFKYTTIIQIIIIEKLLKRKKKLNDVKQTTEVFFLLISVKKIRSDGIRYLFKFTGKDKKKFKCTNRVINCSS